jgi:enoyl-CoA hydratase
VTTGGEIDNLDVDPVEQSSITNADEVLYAVEGSVAHLTLNRPSTLNALSFSMRRRIVELLREAENNPSISIVFIDGAGPSFCSGYDLSSPYGEGRNVDAQWVQDKNLSRWTDQFARAILRDWLTLWDLLKPIVVKAHGNCLAGGTELLSMADIAFAADDARLGYPPMRAMSTPDVPYFPWKMSMARAKYLQLTGNSLSGKEAAEWGWIAKSFPAATLDRRVTAEVQAMAEISSDLLSANKQSLNQAYEIMGMRTHLAQAWSWHFLSGSARPHRSEFFDVAGEKGLKGALDWMNAPFSSRGIR